MVHQNAAGVYDVIVECVCVCTIFSATVTPVYMYIYILQLEMRRMMRLNGASFSRSSR